MKRYLLGAFIATGLCGAMPAVAAPSRPVPYWASISENEARMRVGPSLDYPSNWIYRRRDLPVKVIQVLGLWRKVEDSEGTQGWMHVRLLSDTKTGIVTAPVAPLRESPRDDSRALFRAEKGVVGRLSSCTADWCAFDVRGQRGYIRITDMWGGAR